MESVIALSVVAAVIIFAAVCPLTILEAPIKGRPNYRGNAKSCAAIGVPCATRSVRTSPRQEAKRGHAAAGWAQHSFPKSAHIPPTPTSLSATGLAVRISRDYRHHFPVANLVGNGDAAPRFDGTL